MFGNASFNHDRHVWFVGGQVSVCAFGPLCPHHCWLHEPRHQEQASARNLQRLERATLRLCGSLGIAPSYCPCRSNPSRWFPAREFASSFSCAWKARYSVIQPLVSTPGVRQFLTRSPFPVRRSTTDVLWRTTSERILPSHPIIMIRHGGAWRCAGGRRPRKRKAPLLVPKKSNPNSQHSKLR